MFVPDSVKKQVIAKWLEFRIQRQVFHFLVMESRSRKTILITLILTGLVTFVSGQSVIWVRTSTNARPPQHLFSGNSVDKYGHTLYVCKAWHSNGYSAGKTWKSNGRLVTCKIPGWNQRRVSFSTFYVLTEPPEADYYLEWGDTRCIWGSLPANGVKSCRNRYVGRNGPSSDRRLGTASSSKAAFFYTIDGVEHWRKCGFQILLKYQREIARYQVYNVVYDSSQVSISSAPGKISFGSRRTNNNSPFATQALVEWSHSVTKTSQWSQTEGMERYANIETSFSVMIPSVGSFGVGITLGRSVSVTSTQSGSHQISERVTHSEKVTVSPYSAVRVDLSARKANIRIPYTSSVRVVFADGTSVYKHGVKGIYEGTDFFHFETSISEEPLRTSSQDHAHI